MVIDEEQVLHNVFMIAIHAGSVKGWDVHHIFVDGYCVWLLHDSPLPNKASGPQTLATHCPWNIVSSVVNTAPDSRVLMRVVQNQVKPSVLTHIDDLRRLFKESLPFCPWVQQVWDRMCIRRLINNSGQCWPVE